jgi:hypothetical protein
LKFYVFPLTNPEKQNPAYEIKTRRDNQRPRDMEISEEELEKLVEKKVEERLKEREKESENNSTSEKQKEEKIDRRQFLKMAGLGAGAIGLTSATSALTFSPLGGGGASKQTLSGVLSEGNDVNGQDIVDGGTTIWNTNQQHIPSSQVQNLDSHTSNTSNPHNVTDNQTGAATALSNHANNATAHITKLGSYSHSGSVGQVIAAGYNFVDNTVTKIGSSGSGTVSFSSLPWSPQKGDILTCYQDSSYNDVIEGYRW